MHTLALCSEITPNGAQRTIFDAVDHQARVGCEHGISLKFFIFES